MKYSILTLVTLAAILGAQGAFAQDTGGGDIYITPADKTIPIPGAAGGGKVPKVVPPLSDAPTS